MWQRETDEIDCVMRSIQLEDILIFVLREVDEKHG